MEQTDQQKIFEQNLDEEVGRMSLPELLSFIPEEVLRLTAKGFLAGMRGPKSYEKNSWIDLNLSVDQRIPSILRHISQLRSNDLDPDTGIKSIGAFVLANAVMIAYAAEKNRSIFFSRDFETGRLPPKPLH